MTGARLAFLAVPIVVGLATGCGAPAGKSGGAAALVLRLAVADYPGSGSSQVAERFAAEVETLSNGSIQVPVVYWPTRYAPTVSGGQLEGSVIGAVRSGDVQVAVVPTEFFRTQGPTTLDALQAPFLITSLAGAARVTTGPIAERLQAGLGRIDLEGLGLVPEGLYRPFGFLKPLEAPADFGGIAIRAAASPAMYDLLRSLGAHPVAAGDEDVETAVRSNFARDADPLRKANDPFPAEAYTAGNLVLFPKIDAIIAGRNTDRRLTPTQESTLRRAAAAARAETIAAGNERAEAGAYCRAGGTLVTAPASALAALRAKAAPALAALRADPATRVLIASLGRLAGRGGNDPETCSPATTASSGGIAFDKLPQAVRDPLLPPDGSYRHIFTDAGLRADGAGEADARSNEGVATLAFSGRRPQSDRLFFELSWQGQAARPACRGRAGLVSRRVAVAWYPATPCTTRIEFTWRLEGRDLVIVSLAHAAPAWLRRAYQGTWRRVDCTTTGKLGASPPGGGGRARRC